MHFVKLCACPRALVPGVELIACFPAAMTSFSFRAQRLLNTPLCIVGATHLARSDGGGAPHVGLRCAQPVDPRYLTCFQSTENDQ
jgi:hypothetical protein